MLTSLIIHLKSTAAANLPASLGRAAHALLLRLIDAQEPALAQELHDRPGLKPYTASNLVIGQRQSGSLQVQAGQSGWLRFTGLTGPVSQILQALAAEPPRTVELDGHHFEVAGASLDPAHHPWAGRISYQELAAPYLLAGQSAAGHRPSLRLDFTSPTTFRSQGRYIPLPLPELVFGSLLDRWQAWAPIALPPELRRFAAEAVALSRYDLRTRSLPYKQGGQAEAGRSGMTIVGFTGQATFTALNRDRYWLSLLHLLAAFAFYSGVGYQTGVGLGQVRRG